MSNLLIILRKAFVYFEEKVLENKDYKFLLKHTDKVIEDKELKKLKVHLKDTLYEYDYQILGSILENSESPNIIWKWAWSACIDVDLCHISKEMFNLGYNLNLDNEIKEDINSFNLIKIIKTQLVNSTFSTNWNSVYYLLCLSLYLSNSVIFFKSNEYYNEKISVQHYLILSNKKKIRLNKVNK